MYVLEILQKLSMMDCKSMATTMVTNLKKLRGSDSKLVDPSMHRRLIVNYGFRYVANKDVQLQGYTNIDWARSVEDRKSTSEVCFSLGSAMISWMSRKQRLIALNTAEAECIASNEACSEAVWLQKLSTGLFGQELEPTMVHCDNQSYVKLLENLVFHDRLKHIEIKYHYIRDMVQRREIRLEYVSTNEQTVDVLTKSLLRDKFVYFKDKLGLVEIAPLAEREC
eukprot:PITA_08812